jgi:DNA processing protein
MSAVPGVLTLVPGDGRYPTALEVDHQRPAVLFAQGDLAALGDVRVAIVGTRRCTGSGAGIARELGRELTDAGVAVVSGLALGIDGAAHRGVLDAGGHPVAVVGSGLDVVYPSKHRDLWAQIARNGVLLSEAPLGARPEAWRFPARNRIIAALAHLVVVVESHAAGGSMLTVKEAADRDIPVMAVPGSVRSSSSAGTNQLIAEGCAPVLDATDVIVALGLTAASRTASVDRRPAPDPSQQVVLDAFDWEPVTLEHLATRTGMRLPELALTLEGLLATGWVVAAGGWYERVSA